MPGFLPDLDQTLELEVVIACTHPPPLEAIGPGRILRRERGSFGTHPWGWRISSKALRTVAAREGWAAALSHLGVIPRHDWTQGEYPLCPHIISGQTILATTPRGGSCGAAMAATVTVSQRRRSQRSDGSPLSTLPVMAEIRKTNIPLRLVDPSPPSQFGRLQFYEVREPADRIALHPVQETVDIFYGIFNRKIIPLKPIIHRPW
jgi:hypothetical protein